MTIGCVDPAGLAASPFYINANPQFKTLDINDKNGRPLSKQEKIDLYILGSLSRQPRISEKNLKQSLEAGFA